MNSNDFKKISIERLFNLLKSRHFKKSGNTFRLSNGELSYYINVQSSHSSTNDILKFTINIELTSSRLYRLEESSIPEKDQRHFVKRIGDYFNQPQDKWWTVTNSDEVKVAIDEILKILESKILPELASFQTTMDLMELWRRNQSPGLTEKNG